MTNDNVDIFVEDENTVDDQEENNEENQGKKPANPEDITSVVDISLNKIIVALHFNAIAKIGDGNIKILNSAIEGDKENAAKFYGAGLHIIAAIPAKADTEITRKEALQPLQTYIQWFSGPDIKLSEDLLFLLDMSNDGNEKSSTDKQNNDKAKNESIYVPSFSLYLLLEDGEDEKPAEENAELASDDKKEDDKKEDDKKEDDKKEDTNDGEEKAKGWYITYNIEIKGLKAHPLSDALKKFGKDLLRNFGVSTFDWRNGSNGASLTVGDVLDSLDTVFGKLDPDELMKNYTTNLKNKFPQGKPEAQLWDTKTIKQHLKNQLNSKDSSKLKTADLAICTKVSKDDKSYKLYNSLLIADTLTASIKGIFKTFKNKVNKDDVIYVNNYSDTNENRETGEVADSLLHKYNKKLIAEDTDKSAEKTDEKSDNKKITIEQGIAELDKLVKSNLKEYNAESKIASSEDIVSELTNAGINENDLFEELKKTKYSFLIKTTEQIETNNEETNMENASMHIHYNLLNLLFEKQLETDDTTILDKVKKVFESFITSLKDYLPSKEVKTDVVNSLVGHISDKEDAENKDETKTEANDETKQESILTRATSYMKMLYEDFNVNEFLAENMFDMLLEAGKHTAAHINQLIDKVGTKLIVANKDKFIANIKEYYKTNKKAQKIGKELIGSKDKPGKVEEFFKLKTEDDMKKWVNDNFGSIQKTDGGESIVLAFWKGLSLLPEKENVKTIEITFVDRDPNEQKDDKEITKVTKEEGKELKLPNPPKYAGYDFKGWEPDPNKMEESGETYATYDEQTNDEDEDVEVTYMDIDDPSKLDDEKQYKEFKKITKNPDGSVESLKPKEKDGYEFEKWEPDPDEMSKSGLTFAKYKKIETTEDNKDENKDGKTQAVYYVIPDENGIFNESDKETNKLKTKHTDLDFYIIPMKGLKSK